MKNESRSLTNEPNAEHPSQDVTVLQRYAHCLVYSGNERLRQAIVEAAIHAGWVAIPCSDVAATEREVHESRFEMAWLDVTSDGDVADHQSLCKTVSQLPDVLLAICGPEDSQADETWARQLGTWLYLPGASAEDRQEIGLLCEQALLTLQGKQKVSSRN
ncbi:MAG: hypothetical protein CMJ80_04570 [Planctomycetaceae bacterium]|nr:hypothetical protein [Planctomycetaceae bacterium]